MSEQASSSSSSRPQASHGRAPVRVPRCLDWGGAASMTQQASRLLRGVLGVASAPLVLPLCSPILRTCSLTCLLAHEVLGDDPLAEGVLPALHHARTQLLADGGTPLPCNPAALRNAALQPCSPACAPRACSPKRPSLRPRDHHPIIPPSSPHHHPIISPSSPLISPPSPHHLPVISPSSPLISPSSP